MYANFNEIEKIFKVHAITERADNSFEGTVNEPSIFITMDSTEEGWVTTVIETIGIYLSRY